MTTNKKLLICTLLILTMFTIVGSVSASDSTNDNLATQDTIHESISVDDSQNSLSDTSASTKTTSSSDKDKKITTTDTSSKEKTTTSSSNKEKTISSETNNTIKENANTEKVLKSSETNNKLRNDPKTIYVSNLLGNDENDGLSEDTALATISKAVNMSEDGSTIHIATGTYEISKNITLPKNTLTFIGDKDTFIKRTGTENIFLYNNEDYKTFSFNNLIFSSTTKPSTSLIQMEGNGTLEVNNCKFIDSTVGGGNGLIKTLGNAKGIIDSCEFYGLKTDDSLREYIHIAGYSNTIVKNTIIHDCEDTSLSGCISLKGNGIAEISGCKFYNIKTTNSARANAIIFSSGTNTLKINNCIFENNSINGNNNGIILKTSSSQSTFKINTSSFTNNTVQSIIYIKQKATVDVNYCAFNNLDKVTYTINTATSNGATINANYNWYDGNAPSQLNSVTADTVWIVEDEDEYKLKNGDILTDLDVIIAGFNEPEPLPEDGVFFVSPTGTDAQSGIGEENATTLKHALKNAQAGNTIIMLDGDYTGSEYKITKNITITTKGKNAIITPNGLLFNITKNATATIKNLIISDANIDDNTLIYINNGTLTLDTITLKNNKAETLIYNTNTDYNLTIIKSKILDNTVGNAIFSDANGNIIIKEDTLFENNEAESQGIIYIASAAVENNLTVENSKIIKNTGNFGIFLSSQSNNIFVKNSIFANNNAMYSGALYSYGNLTVSDSEFINNSGMFGAIYTSDQTYGSGNFVITINKSKFINNTASYEGDAIAIDYGEANINNCIFLTNGTTHLIYNGDSAEISAENNYWGVNNNPITEELLEDDIIVTKWIIMNVTSKDNTLYVDDDTTVTVDFTKNNKGETVSIPEITVKATAVNGDLDKTEKNTTNNKATFTFTAKQEGTGKVNIIAPATNSTDDITIKEHYKGTIYVSTTGNDENDGSADAPLKTIGKAINLTQFGSDHIIISEGTYIGNGYHITNNLTITGQGKVILDGNNTGRLFYMNYGDTAKILSLANLNIINANDTYGAAVYSFADKLVLDNINITNSYAKGYLIRHSGEMILKNSKISGHTGGDVLQLSGDKNIIINNTLFENNVVNDSESTWGIVYISSGKGNLVVENSKFVNNKVRQGVIIGSNEENITVKNSKFINNTNDVSYGGAIRASSKLTVINSTFINNRAARDGGAIYTSINSDATITKSIFINNTANLAKDEYDGDAIATSGKLTINYSVLSGNTKNHLIYNSGSNTVNAQFNYWRTNDNPENLTTKTDASNWVIMKVTPSEIKDMAQNSNQTITVDFRHYNENATSTIKLLADSIPELNVTASATNGTLTPSKTITVNNEAIFTYTAPNTLGEINLTFRSGPQVETVKITMLKDISGILEELRKLIDELNQTVNSQNITLTNLTQNNSALKLDIEKLQKALNLNSTELQKALDTIKNLEKNLDLNSTELQKALNTIKQLNNIIQSQINNNTNFQKQITELEAKLVNATTQINNIINQQNNQNTNNANNANVQTTSKTIKLTLKKVKSVKKSAKKLIITATLKKGKTALKNKKVKFTFNGKKYTRKTNKKGVAKLVIKKAVLKKLKVGKKVKYSAKYGKKTVKRILKVKK